MTYIKTNSISLIFSLLTNKILYLSCQDHHEQCEDHHKQHVTAKHSSRCIRGQENMFLQLATLPTLRIFIKPTNNHSQGAQFSSPAFLNFSHVHLWTSLQRVTHKIAGPTE